MITQISIRVSIWFSNFDVAGLVFVMYSPFWHACIVHIGREKKRIAPFLFVDRFRSYSSILLDS